MTVRPITNIRVKIFITDCREKKMSNGRMSVNIFIDATRRIQQCLMGTEENGQKTNFGFSIERAG